VMKKNNLRTKNSFRPENCATESRRENNPLLLFSRFTFNNRRINGDDFGRCRRDAIMHSNRPVFQNAGVCENPGGRCNVSDSKKPLPVGLRIQSIGIVRRRIRGCRSNADDGVGEVRTRVRGCTRTESNGRSRADGGVDKVVVVRRVGASTVDEVEDLPVWCLEVDNQVLCRGMLDVEEDIDKGDGLTRRNGDQKGRHKATWCPPGNGRVHVAR